MKTKNEITATPSDDELATRWKEQYLGTLYNLGCFQRCIDGVWTDVPATQIKAELLVVLIKAKSEGIRPSRDRINSVIEMARLLCLSLPQSKENPLQEFVDSCCETEPEYQIVPGHFHYAYAQWSVLNGQGYISEEDLAIKLRLLGFTTKYVDGRSYWVGLALKPVFGPEQVSK
jgi:hypothetical protein